MMRVVWLGCILVLCVAMLLSVAERNSQPVMSVTGYGDQPLAQEITPWAGVINLLQSPPTPKEEEAIQVVSYDEILRIGATLEDSRPIPVVGCLDEEECEPEIEPTAKVLPVDNQGKSGSSPR